MPSDNFMYCNNVDELIACASLPLHLYPTIEFAVRNVELPLDKDDYNWVTANEIDLFGVDSFGDSSAAKRISRSSNTTSPTFTVDTPTIITGVCIMAYGEPVSTVVEGNQFGPAAAIRNLDYTPGSPINLRRNRVANLFEGGALPDNVSANTIFPAQLDWGGPTWRFIWAFLNAFRLRFDCPHSSYETLINERLVDIGNCCSLIDFSGLSDARMPATFLARRMNARLASMEMPDKDGTYDDAGVVTDPGQFVPINAEQNADGEVSPNRGVANEAAYGRPAALPAVETWYRLPFPMPLDTNTKIKLILDKAAGDEDYTQRMIDEGYMRSGVGPIPGNGQHFRLDEVDQVEDDDGGYAGFTNIPGGMMRLGLGLKGFQVREGVCHQWKRTLSNKALMTQLLTGRYSAMEGTGLCGSPGVDVADKIIDGVLSGQIEQVPVDGGSVGEE